MSFITLLVFLIIIALRRFLKTHSLRPEWQRIFTITIYVIIVLFALQGLLRIQEITIWFWYLLLFAVIGIIFNKNEFQPARPFMIAVFPFVVGSFIADLIEVLSASVYNQIEPFLNVVNAFAIIWLVAMSIIANKQRKALAKERKKAQEEEEQKKIIEIRKSELEEEVMERTAELTAQKEELEHALEELRSTQSQLVHREKMASLGELTAGIAHEIQNPLNFVNNFSEISVELANELEQEIDKLLIPQDEKGRLKLVLGDLIQNQVKINHHGRRADSIVKGMLLHSRKNTGEKELTDINALADEYLRLSYHGLRAKDKSFNAAIKTEFDPQLEKINVIPQDIGRVFLNLFTNAFYSVAEKKKERGHDYEPTVHVSTKRVDSGNGLLAEIKIRDNGNGVPASVREKIYQPFFSTKPTGQGTGLGLSISYDIITKIHGGQLILDTEENEFAEFCIFLPA